MGVSNSAFGQVQQPVSQGVVAQLAVPNTGIMQDERLADRLGPMWIFRAAPVDFTAVAAKCREEPFLRIDSDQ